MDGEVPKEQQPAATNRRKVLWYLPAIIAYVIFSFVLESETAIPAATTMRVGTAAVCMFFIYQLGLDYPGERWPQISFWIALLVNIGIFFTPLVNRPPSRGELMIFAVPDAVVVLAVRTFTYPLTDIHQRATRQTMILGLVVAVAFCAFLVTMVLVDPHTAR